MANIEAINFWATNRIPRVLLTLAMGRLSRVRSPWLTQSMIGIWRQFSALDTDSTVTGGEQTLRDFFTRPLKANARPLATSFWVNPSDGIVGANGAVARGMAMQVKDMPYALSELLGSSQYAAAVEGGQYLTVRLTSGMYHRFHAPCDMRIQFVDYISGDVFNVNPPALKRVPKLFCRNERAVIACDAVLPNGKCVTFYLVAVAAVLVASIRLHALGETLHLRHRGATHFPCNVFVKKGQELGWFEQGSTIVMVWPKDANLQLAHGLGSVLRMGEQLGN